MKGIYGSAYFTGWDFFFEYVDKQSFEKTDFYNDLNPNFYIQTMKLQRW